MNRPTGEYIEVGVDEVGRGALIHDVVAGAVILPCEYDEDDCFIHRVRDSKKCSKKELKELAEYIKNVAIAWGLGRASKDEIEQHNIAKATMFAMHRALDEVYKQVAFDKILVDGNMFKPYLTPCMSDDDITEYIQHDCIIEGDKTSVSIAAASIIAKVERDEKILELCNTNPLFINYGWNTNFGYGTKKHFEAIAKYGVTTHHRKTFLKRFLLT
jgi:ribonuclease HII